MGYQVHDVVCSKPRADRVAPASLPATCSEDPRSTLATVLVADDDPDIRMLVEHHLRKAGFDVLAVEDGTSVLDVIEERTPTLFLLDIDMPGMSGLEVCRKLRAAPRFQEHPVIFLTGFCDTKHVVSGFEAGGADYIRKPVVAAELVARIQTHATLAQARAQARLRAERLQHLASVQSERLEEVRAGQEQLLTDPAVFPDAELAVQFLPAHAAGGDFYEIMRLSDDELALFVADVAGHDLSMPFVTGALKALTASYLNEALSPMESMIQLNASLNRFLAPGRFVSACCARFSRSRMLVELVNAGHPYPMLQPAGEAPVHVVMVGDVLGMFEDVRFETQTVKVREGDRLFLYTDGLTEGFPDESGKKGSNLNGTRLMRQHLHDNRAETIQTAVDGLVDELLRRGGASLDDDVLVLGVEF